MKREVVKSDADLECESFNSSVAEWLTEWNYPGAVAPRVWRRVEDAADLNAQANRDKVIYDMGYEPTDFRGVIWLGDDGSFEIVESLATFDQFLTLLPAYRMVQELTTTLKEAGLSV